MFKRYSISVYTSLQSIHAKTNSITTINRKRWSCVGVALCWPTSVNISLLQPSNCLNPLFIHRHHHHHPHHCHTIIFITNILNNIISLLQLLGLPRSHIFKAFMNNLDQIRPIVKVIGVVMCWDDLGQQTLASIIRLHHRRQNIYRHHHRVL